MADDTAAQAMADPGEQPRRLLALLILDLLRVRAQLEESSTTCEICGEVQEVMPIDCPVFKEVLEQLHTLGLVRKVSHSERADVAPTITWVAAPTYATALGHGSDGGHGGNAREEEGPPPGPSRYPEVLAHPILFALSQQDFEFTLAQMLPE